MQIVHIQSVRIAGALMFNWLDLNYVPNIEIVNATNMGSVGYTTSTLLQLPYMTCLKSEKISNIKTAKDGMGV